MDPLTTAHRLTRRKLNPTTSYLPLTNPPVDAACGDTREESMAADAADSAAGAGAARHDARHDAARDDPVRARADAARDDAARADGPMRVGSVPYESTCR